MVEYIQGAGSAIGSSRTLWSLTGANMNSTADQAFVKTFGFTNFTIDYILVVNPSISLTTAVGGVYVQAAKAGTPLVAATQVYAALTTATTTLKLTLAAAGSLLRSDASLFLSLTTGQGVAAAADLYVVGVAWS